MKNILHIENDGSGQFYIPAEASDTAPVAAYLDYTRTAPDKHVVIIQHTEVGAALRGTGAGRRLVLAMVDWARTNGLKIIPLCPFAKSVFQRDATLHDVLRAGLSMGTSDSF